VEKKENLINVGRMVRLVMCDLVDGDDFIIVGEHHLSKQKRGHFLHSIQVATTK
jgi:hypothetical protein